MMLLKLVLPFCALLPVVCSHGYLNKPASRSSLWRHSLSTTANYNDNELNCGGFSYQWDRHNGKCGLCGDPFNGTLENEAGGKYAKNIVYKCYESNTTSIDVEVVITAYHKGYFEFRLCRHDNFLTKFTEDCLDENQLQVLNETTNTWENRYDINKIKKEKYNLKVQLPKSLTCQQCVIQWKWNTGNSYGCSSAGKCDIGLGPQEQFYGCSDIAILDDCSKCEACTNNQSPTTKKPVTEKKTTPLVHSSSTAPTNSDNCVATGAYAGNKAITEWCITNCALGHCPSTHCACPKATPSQHTISTSPSPSPSVLSNQGDSKVEKCVPKKVYSKVVGMGQWCENNCPGTYCHNTCDC